MPIIDRHEVDLVLQGHDHTYGRTRNVRSGLSVRDDDSGTVYVVSVSGPKMCESAVHPLMRRVAEDTQLYQIIEVDGDELVYRAYTATGELYDAFNLTKGENGVNQLQGKNAAQRADSGVKRRRSRRCSMADSKDSDRVLARALAARPTARQLAWQRLEYIAFAHFGINTFTDREWGDGAEDPALFNPTEFDADQWVAACCDAGMKLLILTAKHHDGFCLWPSAHTEHSLKNSPWRDGRGDVVAEVSAACARAGLKFGIYCSPWDRHERSYGDSPAYNAFFRAQLGELLSDYGPIAEVWFDGACGEDPTANGKSCDWDSYYALVRQLQPEAAIAICGPDVRWVGNESGLARDDEWSVVSGPRGQGERGVDFLEVDNGANDLGSRDNLAEKTSNL